MIRKRALALGINAPIGNYSFRATGITAYLFLDLIFRRCRSLAEFHPAAAPRNPACPLHAQNRPEEA
jgi:hypothetical protein